ncbi:hypothetical protein [Salinimonas chungwhensis]|uniref:hypothetical protein n=1 Tax=Salinimonas chungwhensis TaxID=265425 RepID=UPI000367DDFB|nr:hypothetical protein [Salinimonas chungwhensis]
MSVTVERPRANTNFSEKPLTIPSLPDVRPFGYELVGQQITFDSDAQHVLAPVENYSPLLENLNAIESYLKPYFEVSHTSHDEAIALLNTLKKDSDFDALQNDVFEAARQSLRKVQNALLDSISMVPQAIETLTGEVPAFTYDNVSIGLFDRNGNGFYGEISDDAPANCVSIETTEPVSCFLLYAEKLDPKTRKFLAAIALHIACKCETTPVPHAFGCHDWTDDYITLTTEQALHLETYAKQDAWMLDSFSEWFRQLKHIMGDAISDLTSMMFDMHMMDLTDIPDGDFDETEGETGDFLQCYRESASESLMKIVLQSGTDYTGGDIDEAFLQDLQDWRSSPHCQHTEVVTKLIAVATVIQDHLPKGGEALESLTEIPDFGVGLLYSMPSVDACHRTRQLIDEHAQYQMETCEQCIFEADWTDSDWVEKAKRYLIGWWLMNYLETIMESYNAKPYGAQTES